MCITEVLLRNPILFCYSSISTFILLQYIVTPERGERRGGEEERREERRGGERRGEEERGEEERGEEERGEEERRGQDKMPAPNMSIFGCSTVTTYQHFEGVNHRLLPHLSS